MVGGQPPQNPSPHDSFAELRWLAEKKKKLTRDPSVAVHVILCNLLLECKNIPSNQQNLRKSKRGEKRPFDFSLEGNALSFNWLVQ